MPWQDESKHMQLAIRGQSRVGEEEGVMLGYTALGNPSSTPSTSQRMSTWLAMSWESVATALLAPWVQLPNVRERTA